MKRCNKPAYAYAPSNGYRLCRDCVLGHPGEAVGMLLCSEAGPGPHGRCDRPVAVDVTDDDFKPGERVQTHPATDAWMRGERYGNVEAVGRKLVTVKLDSGRRGRFARRNLIHID